MKTNKETSIVSYIVKGVVVGIIIAVFIKFGLPLFFEPTPQNNPELLEDEYVDINPRYAIQPPQGMFYEDPGASVIGECTLPGGCDLSVLHWHNYNQVRDPRIMAIFKGQDEDDNTVSLYVSTEIGSGEFESYIGLKYGFGSRKFFYTDDKKICRIIQKGKNVRTDIYVVEIKSSRIRFEFSASTKTYDQYRDAFFSSVNSLKIIE